MRRSTTFTSIVPFLLLLVGLLPSITLEWHGCQPLEPLDTGNRDLHLQFDESYTELEAFLFSRGEENLLIS
jgi:hypothetical protein